MSWEKILKFKVGVGENKPEENKERDYRNWKKDVAPDHGQDVDIEDFPEGTCFQWPDCNKQATWQCKDCKAQFCDEHKDSLEGGHPMVRI
tara:strand:- start:209 stop:478 length:270 start_codon:yes stop_codon:yes gene_type:complete